MGTVGLVVFGHAGNAGDLHASLVGALHLADCLVGALQLAPALVKVNFPFTPFLDYMLRARRQEDHNLEEAQPDPECGRRPRGLFYKPRYLQT